VNVSRRRRTPLTFSLATQRDHTRGLLLNPNHRREQFGASIVALFMLVMHLDTYLCDGHLFMLAYLNYVMWMRLW